MESRISQENNPVLPLLKPQPIADKIPLISAAVDVPEVGPKKIPVKKTGSKPAVKVRPSGDSTDVVATTPAQVVTSNVAAEVVIGYRAGGLISAAVDVPEVGPKKIPVKKTGSKPASKVRPSGDSTDVVATTQAPVVTSNVAAEVAIGYRAGGGKMKSVIPKRRKLVKTMIYHAIKDFVTSLFGPPPSACAGAP